MQKSPRMLSTPSGSTPHAKLNLAAYELVDPNLNHASLPLPDIREDKGVQPPSGIIVPQGNMGICNLSLGEGTKTGTYQVTAKDNYFTTYVNRNGKNHMVTRPIDDIKDAEKIKISMKFGVLVHN